MNLEEAVAIIEAAGFSVKGYVAEPIDPTIEEKKQAVYRWSQIGQHENIARRRARAQGVSVDEKYQGPEATVNERNQAYEDFLKEFPYIKRIDV